MHKPLHPWDHVDCMSQEKEEEEEENIQDSVNESKQWLEDYVKKHGGILITTTRNNSDNTRINRRKNNQKTTMGRKPNVWSFQATNKKNLTWENLDMAKKGRPS